MAANAGMVAGSRNRNEFVVLRNEENNGVCFRFSDSFLFFDVESLLLLLIMWCCICVFEAFFLGWVKKVVFLFVLFLSEL